MLITLTCSCLQLYVTYLVFVFLMNSAQIHFQEGLGLGRTTKSTVRWSCYSTYLVVPGDLVLVEGLLWPLAWPLSLAEAPALQPDTEKSTNFVKVVLISSILQISLLINSKVYFCLFIQNSAQFTSGTHTAMIHQGICSREFLHVEWVLRLVRAVWIHIFNEWPHP